MPTPNKGESENDFVQRCIPIVIDEGTAKDGAQASAICHSMYKEKQKMKSDELETVNIGDIEIFETGMWRGKEYTEKDLDRFIENFNNRVAEVYLTIDHSKNATSQFKDALKAIALGWLDKLEKHGTKLKAWFKQVPKVIAQLIKSGALKKKSIEFHKYMMANGRLYENVLEGVTFHGANGLPEVNTLSDVLNLYKSNMQVMTKNEGEIISLSNDDKGIVSISNKDKEIKSMADIELKKDEYQDLLKKSSQVDVFQSQVESFKKELDEFKTEFKKIKDENESLKKTHEDFEKNQKESLKKEADEYISKKINDGIIKPAHKDKYVDEYIMYKKDDEKFKVFKDDIESRGKIINLAPTQGLVTNPNGTTFKYDPEKLDFKVGSNINYEELNKLVEQTMNLKKCTWEEAAIECGVMHPDELNKTEVAK